MYRNDIQLQTKGKGGASPRNSLFVFGTMLRRGNFVCLDINTARGKFPWAVFLLILRQNPKRWIYLHLRR